MGGFQLFEDISGLKSYIQITDICMLEFNRIPNAFVSTPITHVILCHTFIIALHFILHFLTNHLISHRLSTTPFVFYFACDNGTSRLRLNTCSWVETKYYGSVNSYHLWNYLLSGSYELFVYNIRMPPNIETWIQIIIY